MIENFEAVTESFIDELEKIGSTLGTIGSRAAEGVGQLFGPGRAGFFGRVGEAWKKSGKLIPGEGQASPGIVRRLRHTLTTSPEAAALAAGGAGLVGGGAIYEAGKGRGRHGY